MNDTGSGVIWRWQAHSSVEKAGLIGLVKLRYIESDDELSMRGDTLATAIAQDREKGLIPFFVSYIKMMQLHWNATIFLIVFIFFQVCATLGTTGACAFDHLREIGVVCKWRDISNCKWNESKNVIINE